MADKTEGAMRPLLAMVLVMTMGPLVSAQSEFGSVCVAPNPRPKVEIEVWPKDVYNPATLAVRIDKRRAVSFPRKDCIKIPSLDLNSPHVISLMSDGKIFDSFRFRFSDYKSTQLCLLFDGVGAPELKEDTRYTPWCTCKEQKGTAGTIKR